MDTVNIVIEVSDVQEYSEPVVPLGVLLSERAEILDSKIASVGRPLFELLAMLPSELRPKNRMSFGEQQVGNDTARMSGWDYDWHDSGPNPQPWGDWPNSSNPK